MAAMATDLFGPLLVLKTALECSDCLSSQQGSHLLLVVCGVHVGC